MSAVMADMWDQLVFAGGPGPWTAVATQIAAHMEELRPSFRRKFGSSSQRATATVEQLGADGACVVGVAAATCSLVLISVTSGPFTHAGRRVQAPAAISNTAVTTAAIHIGFG